MYYVHNYITTSFFRFADKTGQSDEVFFAKLLDSTAFDR